MKELLFEFNNQIKIIIIIVGFLFFVFLPLMLLIVSYECYGLNQTLNTYPDMHRTHGTTETFAIDHYINTN